MPGTSESVFERPCGRVGVEPTTPRSNRTLHHGQIDKCPCREQAITVRKCSTAELHAPQIGCEAGVEPATSRLQGEVTAIYTTAKPVPGTRDRACMPSRHAQSWREVALVYRHGQTGASRSARTFVSSSSGKRLSCLSYRGEKWYARPELNWHAEAQSSRDCVSAYSTTGV